jgi:hypothetical protein
MPGQRQDRAARKVLFDLVRQGSVELAKNDADAWIGVARQQRGVQVQLIIRRESEDRDCVTYTGAVERFGAVGARCGNVDRADTLHRASKVGIPAP